MCVHAAYTLMPVFCYLKDLEECFLVSFTTPLWWRQPFPVSLLSWETEAGGVMYSLPCHDCILCSEGTTVAHTLQGLSLLELPV